MKTLDKVWPVLATFLLPAVATAAHTISFDQSDNGVLIREPVAASLGGVFSDDVNQPSITVVIPPGALSDDAVLRVRRVRDFGELGPQQTAASPVYRVVLRGALAEKSIVNRLELLIPMRIEITADTAPVHPQIGEIAIFRDDGWKRMMANFFRDSDQAVVTRTTSTRSAFRVAHRSLQARTGAEVERGRDLYFNETWGDEVYWGDVFELHEVLNEVTPLDAVGIGAQVELNKVPQPIVDVLVGNDFDAKLAALSDPSITRALIQAEAVVGVKGFFGDPQAPDRLTSVGLTCAICHVTVTKTPIQLEPDSEPVRLPVGEPILGPPNATLDSGLLLSLTPLVQGGSEVGNLEQYRSWGPGMFDPRFLPGNPFDDDVNNPSNIPPHWNYLDLAEQDYAITWIGILQLRPDNDSLASGPECGIDLPLGSNGAWGTENATITNFEFGNQLPQEFLDRLTVADQQEPGNEISERDLLDIKAFMESIVSPAPGDFDETMAERGWELFHGDANCATCHVSAEGTGRQGEYFTHIVAAPPQGLLGLGIKVPGLRGLMYTAPYFHDGSAATLADVVARYMSDDIPEVPALLPDEQLAIVEYLKSL